MKHFLGTFFNLREPQNAILLFRIEILFLLIYFVFKNFPRSVRLVCSVYCLFDSAADVNNKSQKSSVRRGPGILALDEGSLEILKAQASCNILMVYNPVRLLCCPESLE